MYDWVDKLNHRQSHNLKYALEAWSFLNQGKSVHFTNDKPVATMIPSEFENIRKKSRIFFTSGVLNDQVCYRWVAVFVRVDRLPLQKSVTLMRKILGCQKGGSAQFMPSRA